MIFFYRSIGHRKLKTLNVSRNNLTSINIHCDKAINLKRVYASYNRLTFNEKPHPIVFCFSIIDLDVSYNEISDFPGIYHKEVLNLDGNEVTKLHVSFI